MRSCATVIIMALASTLPRIAHAQRPTPPVPGAIEVPPGYKPFLAGHAVGTQGYVCVAVGGAFGWAPFGPQATLFNDEGEQRLTHFLSPTPYSLLPNPTWQDSRDSSVVWGQSIGSSSDPDYVAPDAIPWLLLAAAVVGEGPTGGNRLIATRYIQRLNTNGGMAPSTGAPGPRTSRSARSCLTRPTTSSSRSARGTDAMTGTREPSPKRAPHSARSVVGLT